MSEPTRPVFTQSMTMHLNGGSTYSELHFAIDRDGVKTLVTRLTRTDGRPKYTKTVDVLVCGNEVFDIMETKGDGFLAPRRPRKNSGAPEASGSERLFRASED